MSEFGGVTSPYKPVNGDNAPLSGLVLSHVGFCSNVTLKKTFRNLKCVTGIAVVTVGTQLKERRWFWCPENKSGLRWQQQRWARVLGEESGESTEAPQEPEEKPREKTPWSKRGAQGTWDLSQQGAGKGQLCSDLPSGSEADRDEAQTGGPSWPWKAAWEL